MRDNMIAPRGGKYGVGRVGWLRPLPHVWTESGRWRDLNTVHPDNIGVVFHQIKPLFRLRQARHGQDAL